MHDAIPSRILNGWLRLEEDLFHLQVLSYLPPQIPICHSDLSILYYDIMTFSTAKFAVCICGMGLLQYRRRIILPAHFCALRFSEPEWRAALLYALQAAFQWLSAAAPAN